MKIAVMGAGAVGCYFGAMLARHGHDVVLIGRPQHVAAIRNNGGLKLDSKALPDVVPVKATTEPDGVEDADLVLFLREVRRHQIRRPLHGAVPERYRDDPVAAERR